MEGRKRGRPKKVAKNGGKRKGEKYARIEKRRNWTEEGLWNYKFSKERLGAYAVDSDERWGWEWSE